MCKAALVHSIRLSHALYLPSPSTVEIHSLSCFPHTLIHSSSSLPICSTNEHKASTCYVGNKKVNKGDLEELGVGWGPMTDSVKSFAESTCNQSHNTQEETDYALPLCLL